MEASRPGSFQKPTFHISYGFSVPIPKIRKTACEFSQNRYTDEADNMAFSVASNPEYFGRRIRSMGNVFKTGTIIDEK